jgi:pimeloyl-ACP methyl ester carboxylesterase
LIVAAWLTFLGACSPGDVEHAVEAVFLALDVAAGANPSVYKSWTPEPSRAETTYEIEGRSYIADFYRPAKARGALVLAPGLHSEGRRETHLVALATTLGRAGFAVLVPDLPNYRALRIGAEDPVGIADGVRHMAARPEGHGKIGIVGISYASGPALLAALQPDIAERIAFVFTLGGYYDVEAVLTYIVTARYRETEGAPWRVGNPNIFGAWMFVRANAARLADPNDRALVAEIAARRLGDARADVLGLSAALGADGAALMQLLGEPAPDRIPERIEALPAEIRSDFAALTLKGRDMSGLRARAILLHGRDDAIVPYTESLALARALGPERAELHLAHRLAHVAFEPESFRDGLEVWRASLSFLRFRS